MGSQALRGRNGVPIFYEDETEERKPEQYFCKEIRDFKNRSRSFHEFYAQAEGAHNPRLFDRDDKNMLEMIVMDALHYPSRYEVKKEWSKSEKAECNAIVHEILSVSEEMVGKKGEVKLEVVFLTMYQYSCKEISVVPLFKIYGNSGDVIFISKNRRRYNSLLSFIGNNDLPHSLVCAAREGHTKTYEIDCVINKYPLVFFTVNSRYYCDRRSEHRRVWLTILKNNVVFDLPFLLVQGFFEHIAIEVNYFTSQINYNKLITDSTKYKFYKFIDNYKDLIPSFGTLVNKVIIMSVAYSFINGLATIAELEKTLFLNGNVLQKIGTIYLLNNIGLPLALNNFGWAVYEFRGSFLGFSLGEERCFQELKGLFERRKVDPRCINHCSDIIIKLCHLGEELLDMFAPDAIKSVPILVLSLKVMLRILPFLIMFFCNNSKKPTNYFKADEGNRVFKPDDGDYSLKHFLETAEAKSLVRLAGEENMERLIKNASRDCAVNDSPFICISEDKNLYISVAPTFMFIEKLLGTLNKNARVYASKDNSLYEISSEETLYQIYPFQNDKLNLEIQYLNITKNIKQN